MKTLTASCALFAGLMLALPSFAQDALPRRFSKHGPTRIGDKIYYPFVFEGHVHTHHSPDARHPTRTILETAERLGMDAIILTDHGSIESKRDLPNYKGRVVAFMGAEIGGQYGHAVYWNVNADDPHPPSTTPLQTRCEFAHQRGGLLVFAHPGWWIEGNDHDPMEWMTRKAMRRGGAAGEVDAIELWNGVYRTPLPKLIDAWVDLLEGGVYVPIVGVNGQPPGSIITNDRPALEVVVDVIAPEGGTLRLYRGREVVEALELEPGSAPAKAKWSLPMPREDTYLRIDIQRRNQTRGQTPVSLLSNPVIVDVAPKRGSWR